MSIQTIRGLRQSSKCNSIQLHIPAYARTNFFPKITFKMHLNRLIEIIINIILFVQLVLAKPYSWGSHHSNYDASLDPIAWSRSFVKDAIRKPRQYRTNALEHNSIDGEEKKKFPTQGFTFGGFGKRRSSRGNFGKEYAMNWLPSPSTFVHNGENNNMQKRRNRRREKLNARHRYGLVKDV